MKVGKVSEAVLKRSILKQVKTKREEVIVGAGIGEDCTVLRLEPGEVFVLSTDPITGTVEDIGTLSIHVTANDLAASGAEPIGVLVTLLLPESIYESDIKEIMQQIEAVCNSLNMQVMGGHTEVTKAVNQPIISITGVGKAKEGAVILTSGARPGQDIVVTKWIAMEGTSIVAKEKEKELLERFPESFVKTAQGFDQYLSVVKEAATAVKSNVSAMHDITEGGIFGALWEMAEASGVGLEIELKKIPIRQETVEICEVYDLNPYCLISSGSMLIAADNGFDLVRDLEKAGISGTVIGKAVSGNDRVLINDDERRYLEPPKSDEIYKL
ncbi:AIR synthase family protein [Anaerosacchariphilus polymeriproducens]|uniref:Hydrogenase maturation factor n=1 Tax=Anaerosacchariphilus polymeriproducens TaxID=1812858 RepID=A0A371AYA7_9FIRM|nr:AIR synthase family protein [Anaerosacchariphilus polymeriproducens]RDU24575.1 hydrogenase maturation factor [Anaerosacchariphilus polymeriproducens]